MSLTPEQVTDCRIWTKAKTTAGYGMLRLNGKPVYAHRWAYEQEIGPIPDGLELDHLCRNRACYNPLHLEPVTHAENMRRGYWGAKTHCPQGHPYEGDNVIQNSGGRMCRECVRARKRAAYRAQNPEDKSQASRTHCPRGHELSGDNLHQHRDGRRECRTCRLASNRESARRAYWRKKEATA